MAREPSSPSGKPGDGDPLVGSTIDGRYAVHRLLGAGGMGAVYEASHVGTGRRVAVKVILGDRLAKNEKLLTRFQREARAAGKVESPHIAQVLDTGVDAETGTPFLVMEFLEGEDLHAVFKRAGALRGDAALRVVAQALRGLSRAHQAGVVHRDIKPANLFLARREGSERVVKLLDFGIAKEIDPLAEETGGLTNTGALLGSPLYMSPEQVRNRRQLDHRTDLWSMGIVLFQGLAGRTPFQDADSIGDLIMSICATPAPWLQDVARWVPAEAAVVVQRALAIDPEQRFPTADAMLAAILPLLSHGEAIHEGMLVTVDMATRAYAAPRVSTPAGHDGRGPYPPQTPGFSAPAPSYPAANAWAVAPPSSPALPRAPMPSSPSASAPFPSPMLAPGAAASGGPYAPFDGRTPLPSAPYAQLAAPLPGLPVVAAITDAGVSATRGGTAPRSSRGPLVAVVALGALAGIAGAVLVVRQARPTPSAAATVTAMTAPDEVAAALPAPPSAAAPRVEPSAPLTAAPVEATAAATTNAPMGETPKPPEPRVPAPSPASAASPLPRASASVRPGRGPLPGKPGARKDDETSRK